MGSGFTGATSTSASTAYPGCPVVAKHERKGHHPRGGGRTARLGRVTSNHAPARTFRLPAIANSANRAALRDGTSEVSTARINQCSGVSVSRNKQLFPSFPNAIILSVCCTTTQTFTVLWPALFYSRFCVLTHTRSMAAAHDKRTDDWASLEHFHRYAYRYATKIRAGIQREGSREWTVLSKEEPRSGNDTPAPFTMLTKNAKDGEARSVLPRGSVIQQNMTKLAIATRSTAAQTVNPGTDGRSLLHWQTAATRSTATQTPNSVTDGRSLQQWRSIQGNMGSSFDGFSTVFSTPLSRLVTRVGSRRHRP